MRRVRRFAFWIALLTAASVVVLRPLAQASPADPSWIAGFYDGSDLDDVIHFLLTCAGVATAGLPPGRHAARAPGAIIEVEAYHRSADPGGLSSPRAPPPRLSSFV